jgi:hypothetical protein
LHGTDDMRPKSSFIRTLNGLPISPCVKTHSIIAVKSPEAARDQWNDGVVSYYSAHLEDAVSELIVHSGRSAQSEPATIEGIRRILLDHLKEEDG